MYFQLFWILFELSDSFVSMLISIGFELVDPLKEEWLCCLIGLRFLQRTWF